MTDARCEFSIPNMTDEWYGFFEKPSMQIDSIEKVATKTWRVKANARAAYCANFCRSPQLRFAFSFRPNDIGADNREEDNNNNNDDGNNVKDGGRIEGLVGIDINENVPSATTSAKLNGSNRKVSIRNLSRSFRNQQQPIHAFCDEYGSQYRTHLTVQIGLQFDVVVDNDKEIIMEKPSSSFASSSVVSSSAVCKKDAVDESKEEKSTNARNQQKAENAEEEKELECCVCLDARATMMNETCKHTVMCHTCAFAFLSRSKELQQPYSCPICRAQIGNMYIDTKTI